MDAKARDKALERARSLEKGGQGDAAAKLFREAGAVEEAARVLGALRRPRDAAQLLLDSLGVPPPQAGRPAPAGKKRGVVGRGLFRPPREGPSGGGGVAGRGGRPRGCGTCAEA